MSYTDRERRLIEKVAHELRMSCSQDGDTKAFLMDGFELRPPGSKDHPADEWTLYTANAVWRRHRDDPDDIGLSVVGKYKELDEALIGLNRIWCIEQLDDIAVCGPKM